MDFNADLGVSCIEELRPFIISRQDSPYRSAHFKSSFAEFQPTNRGLAILFEERRDFGTTVAEANHDKKAEG